MESKSEVIKYCDSDSRHRNGGINCCYVTPEISRLVESSHKRSHSLNGFHYNHFSFTSARDASLNARLHKRFESLENDRQEHMIDFLNAIDDKQNNACGILRNIENLMDQNTVPSSLIRHVYEAFKPSGLISTIGCNIARMVDGIQGILVSNGVLKSSIDTKYAKLNEAFKKVEDKVTVYQKSHQEFAKQINDTGMATNGKLDIMIELFSQHLKSVQNDKNGVKETRKDYQNIVETTLNALNRAIEVESKVHFNDRKVNQISCDVNSLANVFNDHSVEVNKELRKVKEELVQINSEIISMRDAIVDILPEKLITALKATNHEEVDAYGKEEIDSNDELEIEFVDAKQLTN